MSVDNRFAPSPEAMDVRREVLGDEYVNSSTAPSDPLTQEFQAFVTNYCWGEIWTDDRLSRADHSLVVMAVTAALGRMREFEIHARGALRNGLTPDQLTAVLRQIAVYAGVPAAVSALPCVRSAISDYERGDLMTTSRRSFLLGALGIAAGSALTACASTASGGSGNKKQLTMVTWGGTTETGLQNAIATPFTKATGIPVQMTAPVDYGKYMAQVQNHNITWNWVDFEGWFEVLHKNLWMDLPPGTSGNAKDYIQLPGAMSAVQPWGIMNGSYSFAIAYRTDMGHSHPQSWAEFFDPKSLAGKRSIYNWPYGMIEVALLADGVAYHDLYPLDVERALGKLDNVRSSLVFWNSGAELQQQLTAGTAPFAFAWNNRVAALGKSGQPVALEWAENLQDGGWDVAAKADPLRNEVVELIKFAAQPKNQAKRALATGYSPPTKTALASIPASERHWYNVDDANLSAAIGSISLQWWADNFNATIKKWNAWASA